ncbi:MAG: hypothetical protein JJE49_10870, partial [Peptostreptococcaceae bacterium]|nr:hypothetical protein [Peptostreptococcaceae bacterium]
NIGIQLGGILITLIIGFSFGKLSGLIIRLLAQKEVPFSDADEFIVEKEPAFNII